MCASEGAGEPRGGPPPAPADPDGPVLIAYRTSQWPPLRLARASSQRRWMAADQVHHAIRCLPLLIANQAGWMILNSHALQVTWTGREEVPSLTIDYLQGYAPYPAVSHFGHGILTWNIPFLFETPPGYNLLVRGPANWPKDGACPLEGIVETDWSVAPFTMNWKLTRPGVPVTFDKGEPIGMIVPQRRGELEAFRPQIRDLDSEPEVARWYRQWVESRQGFLADLKVPGSLAARTALQKHYLQGMAPDGHYAREHQRKLTLRDFED
jgi:Family of unknown function (DUF6065)